MVELISIIKPPAHNKKSTTYTKPNYNFSKIDIINKLLLKLNIKNIKKWDK